MKNKLREKNWYAYAVAGCITVTLYVVLTRIKPIAGVIGTFAGYFETVLYGLILTYLMNPLAKLFHRKLFARVKKDGLRWILSVILTLVVMILLVILLLEIFIPQLADSISRLINNMDSYLASLETFLTGHGIISSEKYESLVESLFGTGGKISTFLSSHAGSIINVTAAAGGVILDWAIAFILSAYMLMSKDSMKSAALRLMNAVIPKKVYNNVIRFFTRCDDILVNYIVFSLLDAVLVGCINAIFMAILGMEYVGLVSLLVGLTNLIPTFGPIIGGAIGGLILLLVNPIDALIFVLFTIVLQFLDGYVIKPKLFGNKLGVSGLLILASIIVCGEIWGIVGILLAIPIAAILDFVFGDVIMPLLEKRRERINAESAEAEDKEEVSKEA